MYICQTQQNNCVMIPSFIIVPKALHPILPPGVYDATINEFQKRFVTNEKRRELFEGMKKALKNIFESGCPQVFIDGSYVTAKPKPNDYEICWDMRSVNPALLDKTFIDFSNGTRDQKLKYLGEFFPVQAIEKGSGKPFLEFFQTDKESGNRKGIIRITNYLN